MNPSKARMFAEIRHAGQTYNDEVPYTYHLEQVVSVLKRFGFDGPLFECAGLLHDTIEDTGTSYNDIKDRFGENVAELVYAVTSELGRNRKERNAKTYPKIKGNFNATVLKLADRIANVEYGSATGGKVDMYRKEFDDFEYGIRDTQMEVAQALYKGIPIDPLTSMWNHLKTLLK